MTEYIALLRGINVGGHRVPMERLRALFGALGYRDVWTFIASGNVGFTAPTGAPEEVARTIEAHLRDALGYDVPAFLRTPTELRSLLEDLPPCPEAWDPDAASHYVLFLDGPPPDALRAALSELQSEVDRFTVEGREVHWWTRGRLSDSPLFGAGLERVTRGIRVTSRNVTSLRRLMARQAGRGAG
jgi:uncharacterized protein (DUF1697 family)